MYHTILKKRLHVHCCFGQVLGCTESTCMVSSVKIHSKICSEYGGKKHLLNASRKDKKLQQRVISDFFCLNIEK